MKYARENKIKTQMSARESFEAVIRMLTVFATDHSSRQNDCEMRQVATQAMLDEHQTGIDRVFWIDTHNKFLSMLMTFTTLFRLNTCLHLSNKNRVMELISFLPHQRKSPVNF
jgi:hypothetical protein